MPRIETNASFLHFNNTLTIDIPTTTTPITGFPILEGSTTTNAYGNLAFANIMAKTVLFSGLQIPNAVKAMEYKTLGTSYLLDSDRDILIEEVIITFDQWALLNNVEKLINESEKRLQKETKRVEKAIEQGLAIPYDRDKLLLASLELEAKKTELNGTREVILEKIYYLTGFTETEIQKTNHELTPLFLFDEQLSVENKHELKALHAFEKAQTYVLKKEKGSFLPQIAAYGGYNYTSLYNANASTTIPILNLPIDLGLNEATISPNWFIGIGAKWTIFGGFERIHKIAETKLSLEQTQLKLTDTHNKLNVLLKKNIADLNTQQKQLHIGEQKIKVAQNNLSSAIRQYEEGLISITDRLASENDYYRVSLELMQQILSQRRTAIETLKTTGNLFNYITKN